MIVTTTNALHFLSKRCQRIKIYRALQKIAPVNSTSINFSALTQMIDVNNGISLPNYYRRADNLVKQLSLVSMESSPSLTHNDYTRVSPSNAIDMQFQNLSLSLPLPKQETLYRHSFFRPKWSSWSMDGA
ncbi:Uncharacterized protein Fot_54438 [Forsythia ovata]|uniref:Uncharacterized protein n=1 Tax=Forsythia ovata TaxID=205694 RepID=A0ABD1P732_9LAMI